MEFRVRLRYIFYAEGVLEKLAHFCKQLYRRHTSNLTWAYAPWSGGAGLRIYDW